STTQPRIGDGASKPWPTKRSVSRTKPPGGVFSPRRTAHSTHPGSLKFFDLRVPRARPCLDCKPQLRSWTPERQRRMSARLHYMILCDAVVFSQGKFTYYGVFDRIQATRFPCVHGTLSIAVQLSCDPGPHVL